MNTFQEIVLRSLEEMCYKLHNVTTALNTIENETMCDADFDGLFCWPYTKASVLAVQPCTNKLIKSTFQGQASRQCLKNGSWFTDENLRRSNLSECGDAFFIQAFLPEDDEPDVHPVYEEWFPVIRKVKYLGYSISFLSLLLSVCILVKIKRLHCARNRLHVNLFVSFIMRIFMAIVKDGLFVGGDALLFDFDLDEYGEPIFTKEQNYSWICKTIVTIEWYFVLSNFNLMLMEGIYLYNLMFSNFLSEQNEVTTYTLLGWGLPSIFVLAWVILKMLYEDVLCWTTTENKYINLLVDIPLDISVTINFVLFIVIVRVLMFKLNNNLQQKKRKYIKLLKATVILIPLFGVPYTFSLLFSFGTYGRPVLDVIWIFADQTVAAFQGLFASLLYCLLNNDVQIEVKRKYMSLKDRNDKEFRRSRTISNTQQFSLQVNDYEIENDKHIEGTGNRNGNNTSLF